MLERRIEVDEVTFECDEAVWGVLLQARIRVTTPEQEPALVTLHAQVRLQNLPAIPHEQLREWMLRLVAERLSQLPPEQDPPETT